MRRVRSRFVLVGAFAATHIACTAHKRSSLHTFSTP